MQPTASGFAALIAAMSSPNWNPGRRHGTHTTLSPKAFLVSFSPSFAVANAMPGIRMQVVDVRRIDQTMHRGVDRGGRATLAVQGVVERGDHLVFTVDTRVDVDERTESVQPQHRKAGLGERTQVAPGTLHPHQLDILTGHRIDSSTLHGRITPRIIGDLRIRTQAIATRDQLLVLRGHGFSASGEEMMVDRKRKSPEPTMTTVRSLESIAKTPLPSSSTASPSRMSRPGRRTTASVFAGTESESSNASPVRTHSHAIVPRGERKRVRAELIGPPSGGSTANL